MSLESTYFSLDDLSTDKLYQNDLYLEAYTELSLNSPDRENVHSYKLNPDEKYFDKVKDKPKVKCNICLRELKYSDETTSNLRKYLKTHKGKVPELCVPNVLS
ncbi:17202_t:CDS:2, partial [Gigaspora margarita]